MERSSTRGSNDYTYTTALLAHAVTSRLTTAWEIVKLLALGTNALDYLPRSGTAGPKHIDFALAR